MVPPAGIASPNGRDAPFLQSLLSLKIGAFGSIPTGYLFNISYNVPPAGIEPTSAAPQAAVLSVERRERNEDYTHELIERSVRGEGGEESLFSFPLDSEDVGARSHMWSD